MYDQFAKYYDEIFTFKEPTFRFLTSWLPQKTSQVLDLGCGTGSYLCAMAQKGHLVVGVDLNQEMLQIAQRKCPQGVWLALDLTHLDRLANLLPKSFKPGFDLIFCTGNVLSYLKTTELKRLIKDVSNLLNTGGYWVFQVVNWEKILRQPQFQFPVIENQEKNLRFFRYYRDLSEKGAIFETRLEKDGKTIFEDRQFLFAHTQKEFMRLHQDLNLKPVDYFGDFQKNPFNPENSGALIGVYRKQK